MIHKHHVQQEGGFSSCLKPAAGARALKTSMYSSKYQSMRIPNPHMLQLNEKCWPTLEQLTTSSVNNCLKDSKSPTFLFKTPSKYGMSMVLTTKVALLLTTPTSKFKWEQRVKFSISSSPT